MLVPVAAAIQPEARADGWTDVTTGDLAVPGTGVAASWGDYDGDGDHDLAVAQHYSPPYLRLFRYDAGAFVDVTSSSLPSTGPTLAAVWADADNDGDLDLFRVHDFEPRNVIQRNDGGTFTTAPAIFSSKGGVGGAAWGDVNQDGQIDIVFVMHSSQAWLYWNTGALTFAAGPMFPGTLRPTWVDYDGDGDLDLHQMALAYDKLWRNDSGVLVDAMPGIGSDSDQRRGAAWGDYDNDGDPDLYLAMASGSNRLLRNDGTAIFTDVTGGTILGLAGNCRDATWADFDNDGDLDLFVVRSPGANVLFRNEGAGAFTDAGSSALDGGGSRGTAAWADHDGDGDLDVYVPGDSTAARLIRNDLPAGQAHWLHVDLIGVQSNRSGIGARVRVKAGGFWQMRDVSGGDGFSQGSLTCEFGLGAATVVESLTVRWGSGVPLVLTGIPANQRIRIPESGTTDVPDGNDVGVARLGTPSPNPSWGSVALRLTLPREQRARLDIVDITGRQVRLILDRPLPAGRHDASWDGRNDRGAAVPAGIYWVRLMAGPDKESRRLVRLR